MPKPSARDELVRVCGIPSGDPSLASFRVKSSPSWTEPGRPQYRNVTAPGRFVVCGGDAVRSEEHTLNSSHSQISYAVFCLKKKNDKKSSELPATPTTPNV